MEIKTCSYKDLIVWQKGIQLAKLVYRLTTQFRRAVISVPSNIAGGQARRTTGESMQLISNAKGSIAEVDTQLILSVELKFCNEHAVAPAFELVAEIRKMLSALRRTLAACA